MATTSPIGTPRSRSRVRLADRRRAARKRRTGLSVILGVFVFVLGMVGLWQPAVRAERITITNGDTALVQVAHTALAGTYGFIIPRDSIFFLASSRVRQAILAARPAVAAVSVARTGFDSIAVTPDPRTPAARWCGLAATTTPADTAALDSTPSSDGSCYFFDGTGFLYAPTPQVSSTTATSTSAGVPYVVYAALVGTTTTPLAATVAHADALPQVFDFANQMHTFGATVISIVLRGDEVDFFLKSGTRVTYVLGQEQDAYALLAATKDKISLNDGSLRYVDLRFPGKVYYMKRVASANG